MTAAEGSSPPLARIAASLCPQWTRPVFLAFLFLFSNAAPARAQISPGPLSRAHQALSGPTECTSCHAVGKGTAELKCRDCHTEIAQELSQGRGLHFHFPNKENCAQCHSEHNGEDFQLIHWVPSLKGFDHGQTGYALEGKHAGLECNQCHFAAHISPSVRPLIKMKDLNRTFLGLSPACVTCHTDPHHGQLGQTCQQCHSFQDWKTTTKIDHDKTRFPLTGLHAQVACAKCHTPAAPGGEPRFTGIPFGKCSDCHADPHHGSFAQSCDTCHTTAGWKRILPRAEFDHSKTQFPLLGKHAQVDCLQCHVGGDFKKPLVFAKCSDCHADAHGGQFAARLDKGECSACHTVEAWKPSLFGVKEHAATSYPLEGRHAELPCAKCHIPAGAATRYKIAFAKCLDCHSDAHGAQFALAPYDNHCEQCHTLAGFQPSTFTIEQHQNSRFPLRGAHLAVICSDCHVVGKLPASPKLVPYRFKDRSCTGCHADPHKGQFAARMAQKRPDGSLAGCEACHSVDSWTDLSGFDHSRTAFPLVGAHAKVGCDECHAPAEGQKLSQVDFRAASTRCSGCHEDVHAGQFAKNGQPPKCEVCHNSERWKPSLFDHEIQSDFSLKGAHLRVACDACHKNLRIIDGKQVLFYKPTPRKCAECHN